MKYFGLAAAALMLTVSASADTVVSASCGSFNFGAAGGNGTFVCPTLSSLDNGGVVTPGSEFVLYYSDYSNGLTNTVDVTTLFSFNAGAHNPADTLTSTGGSNSTPATSADLATFQALIIGPPPEPAGFVNHYDVLQNGVSIGYTNTCVSGCAIAQTGLAFLVFSYNPAVTTSAPEPGSMMLLGSGLLAAGLIGRKKLARK